MEIDEQKLNQFFAQRIATLEQQIRQFEQGFIDCINTDQNDNAAAIFARMVVRRVELTQLIEERERLRAAVNPAQNSTQTFYPVRNERGADSTLLQPASLS